ncbi:MAG: four helix bundle protein [Prevotellaceae bacterium]|nr:four helix bundle protein [Prevotellaceae bacterium]
MTTDEILQLESLNATSVHFVLEGTFWHVYERSAFLTYKYLKELKMTRKYIKAVGRDIVYGGFPKNQLNDLIEKGKTFGAKVAEQGEKRCSLIGFPETDGYVLWREGWSLKEKRDYKLAEGLPVYKAIYDLLFALFGRVRHFPKDFQYTLGERIKNQTIELAEMIYHANVSEETSGKMKQLRHLCAKVETLRLLLRMCYDLRLYNLEAYVRFNEQVEDISKQLNGWRKQCQVRMDAHEEQLPINL